MVSKSSPLMPASPHSATSTCASCASRSTATMSPTPQLGRRRPRVESDADADLLVRALGESLEALAANAPARSSSSSRSDKSPCDAFVGANVPAIRLRDYLARLVRYVDDDAQLRKRPQAFELDGVTAGVRALALAMVYIDRMCARNDGFALTRENVHRVCMTAVLVATKMCEDRPFRNSFWSRVGGVPLPELNALEASMMHMLRWDAHVPAREFDAVLATLIGHQ